jgi:hypothetical protein
MFLIHVILWIVFFLFKPETSTHVNLCVFCLVGSLAKIILYYIFLTGTCFFLFKKKGFIRTVEMVTISWVSTVTSFVAVVIFYIFLMKGF